MRPHARDCPARHAVGGAPAVGAAGPWEGGHLRLRPHRVRPHPRGKRPPLRRVLRAQAVPRARGLRRDLRGKCHGRQRQDLRRRPRAGRAQREAGAGDDRGLPRGHRGPRARPARPRAARLGDDRTDCRAHPGVDRQRPRLRRRRRRVLPRALVRGLWGALPPRHRADGPGGGGRGRRPQGGSARLRPVEGDQGRRGHLVARAVGGGPPGLAHRVLGDGGADPGRRLRHPRRRLGPGLSTSRERGGADPGGAWQAARPAVGAQRHGPDRRGEDGEVGREHRAAARSLLEQFGRDALVMYFLGGHYRQPLAFSDELLEEAGAARAARARGGCGAWRRGESPEDLATCSDPSSRPWPRTSTRRRRSPPCSNGFARRTSASGSAPRTCARCWASSAWRTCSNAGRGESTPRRRSCSSAASARVRSGDFAEADRLRDELAARGWDVRDGPDGPELIPRDK